MTSPGVSESDQPAYERIAASLRNRINESTYAAGSKLPSEAVLRREFGTSRGPVRQALDLLRREGLIAVSRGSSARVLNAVPQHPFQSLMSFTEFARSTGRTPGQQTLVCSRELADETVAKHLDLDVETPIVHVLRLRFLDDVPAMLERAWFPLEVGTHLFTPNFDPDLGSIYRHLEDCGVDLFRGRHSFDATSASEHDARVLGVATGSPLLRVRRDVTDRGGMSLEHASDLYLPGIATVSVDNTIERESTATQLVALPARQASFE